jgi:2-polyprenyl-3-methyl-5-hydroxy-6-metoxy-1,4-benzoquinol methylase
MSTGFIDNARKLTTCIACENDELVQVLNLGLQPLANSYKKSQDELEAVYPLAINRCSKCWHVQLTHMVNPDFLFKNYLYVSGTSQTQLQYFDWFAERAISRAKKKAEELTVLDIGCNDGSQLDAFRSRNVKQTFGIDPAVNLHETSTKKHTVSCGYFNADTVSQLRAAAANPDLKFDIIVCQNAFAHNYDQAGFLKLAAELMHDDSQLIITTSQIDMLINKEFDTIYHEHLSFYNVQSMQAICARAELTLMDVETHPIHGTSGIYTLVKPVIGLASVNARWRKENEAGFYSYELYEEYARSAWRTIMRFKESIERYTSEGYTVVGYGAAAKGNTLLNAANTKLVCIVDDNPLKQGLFTPGVGVPVVAPEFLNNLSDKPVLFVPLAWNFFDEIVQRIKTLRGARRDLYLRYFPKYDVSAY